MKNSSAQVQQEVARLDLSKWSCRSCHHAIMPCHRYGAVAVDSEFGVGFEFDSCQKCLRNAVRFWLTRTVLLFWLGVWRLKWALPLRWLLELSREELVRSQEDKRARQYKIHQIICEISSEKRKKSKEEN